MKRNKITLGYIIIWLQTNKPEFELVENNLYKNSSEKLKFFHNAQRCQEYFEMNWNNLHNGQDCPVCAGRQVGQRTSLAYLRHDLALEWHPDNKKSPNEVVCGSNERFYWICSVCDYGCNKEWITSPNSRTNKNSGCPACSNPPKVLTDRNRLSIRFPEISAEWDYNKNKDIPHDVSFGCNEKRWWVCPKGHEYFSSIKNRTKGHNCKKCSDEQQESKIATELKKWAKNTFKYVELEYEILQNPKTNHWLKCDIYIGQKDSIDGIYVEIHGEQHYIFRKYYYNIKKDFEECRYRDNLKKKFAKKNGQYVEVDLRKIKNVEDAIRYVLSEID